MSDKILYMAKLNIDNSANGVNKKIKKQIETFNSYGYSVLYLSLENNSKVKKIFDFLLKILYFFPNISYTRVKKVMKENDDIRVVYIRHYNIDYKTMKLLIKFKQKNNIRVLLEIPTYPFIHEYNDLRSRLILLYRKKIINFYKKCIDRIITFSKDSEIYGIKCINISNGVEIPSVQFKYNNKDSIILVAVAQLMFWHGYDRLINGLLNYYSIKNKQKVVFHIVGDGPELDRYKGMVQNNICDYVIFHGELSGSKLAQVYINSDIGIDSLGRHRSGIYYNSSLKGKEYAAYGLPIVSGVETEYDFLKNYPYYYRVASDDSPIDISEIVDFYNFIYNKRDYLHIKNVIREKTNQNFSMYITLKPVLNYLKSR